MTHADIIRSLGGPADLARKLGLPLNGSVGHWPVRGIPAHHWHTVVALAAEAGLVGVTGEALKATKPGKRGRRSEHP